MIEDPYISMYCVFRMVLNSDQSINEFKSKFSNHHIRINPLRSDQSKHAISIVFDNTINLDALAAYLNSNKDDVVLYRFIIYIDTEYDTRIIDIPDYVIEAIRRLGGNVRFKYTFIDEDAEED